MSPTVKMSSSGLDRDFSCIEVESCLNRLLFFHIIQSVIKIKENTFEVDQASIPTIASLSRREEKIDFAFKREK